MSLENLLEKIRSEGRAEAEAILAQSRAETRLIEDDAKERAGEIRQHQLAEARRAAENEARRLTSNARSAARLELLAAKREFLERVQHEARTRVVGLSAPAYAKWLKGQLLAAVRSGTEEIVPAASDRHVFDKDFLDEVNRELVARGIGGNLRLAAEDARVDRGCILREGGVEWNLSLDILLAQAFTQAEDELAGMLFKEPA